MITATIASSAAISLFTAGSTAAISAWILKKEMEKPKRTPRKNISKTTSRGKK